MAIEDPSSSLTDLSESNDEASKAQNEATELREAENAQDRRDDISSNSGEAINEFKDERSPRVDLPALGAELAGSNRIDGGAVLVVSRKMEVSDSDEDEAVSPVRLEHERQSTVVKDGREPDGVGHVQMDAELVNGKVGDVLGVETIPHSGGEDCVETITSNGARSMVGGDSLAPVQLSTQAPSKVDINSTVSTQSSNAVHSTTIPAPISTPTRKFTAPKTSSTGPKGAQNNEVLMAELKAMKIASLQARNAALEAEVASKRNQLEAVTKELKFPAFETVKRHIKLLHDYNDIRDVGQGLVGMIADNRGVRIGELYEEFGVGLRD